MKKKTHSIWLQEEEGEKSVRTMRRTIQRKKVKMIRTRF
jgi:hypothetical protein